MARFFLGSLGFMVIASIGLGAVFYYMVAWGVFGPVPDTKEILNHENSTASEIYSSDGVLLGKYFLQERTNASFDELPSHLIDALIATEDVRFYQHNGVDLTKFSACCHKNAASRR